MGKKHKKYTMKKIRIYYVLSMGWFLWLILTVFVLRFYNRWYTAAFHYSFAILHFICFLIFNELESTIRVDIEYYIGIIIYYDHIVSLREYALDICI